MRQRVRNSKRPGHVRIIGGRWRRHRIGVGQADAIRPTPDRIRETLFNWLAPGLPGAHCLDLFAGTGVLAFEALSRGAASAVLVERSASAAAALRAESETLGAEALIVEGDALAYLRAGTDRRFDIVFVDPPYAMAIDDLLAVLPARLKAGARIYLERERGCAWPAPDGLKWDRRGEAGAVAFGLGTYTAPAPV